MIQKPRISSPQQLSNGFRSSPPAIVAGPELARTIADLKKFTAREILVQLKRERRDWLLNQLRYFCATYKGASEHQVWQAKGRKGVQFIS
jgi:hypothetical protein